MQKTLHHIFFICLLGFNVSVIYAQKKAPKKTIEAIKQIVNDSTALNKEIALSEIDSTQNDSIKKKPFLSDNVVYSAKDYMRLNRKSNKMYLYNNAKIDYTDMNIEAGSIIVHQAEKEVSAKGIIDTSDTYTQTPIFSQGENVVEPDTIRFNFDSKKALIYNSKTQQDGFNIKNEVSKRENDSVIYMKNVRFTTSKNIEDPEYYFYARRIKFMPKKKIVTGLVNMYIADVPTPLGLPFGYFPMQEGDVSGFIIPSFNDSDTRGFTLQNGGYYFAINDYLNLTTVGDYSTNGSFAIRADSDYVKRYKYNGSLSIRFENNKNSERGFPDFSESNNYNINWQHNQDSKASPNSRFSASVNFGSSRFFEQSINQSNIGSVLNNELSSSISYSKRIPVEPEINFDTALRISQNTRNESISINTPINISINRIYPLAPKSGTKKGIIQNINFQVTTRAENRIQTTDSLFLKSEMFKNAENGIQHSIPISTNFKVLKYLSITAGSSYTENWVFKTFRQRYDTSLNEGTGGITRDTIRGFDSFRTYNLSTGLGTVIYGNVQFKNKNAKIKAIRHVVRPSVSYSYSPSFDQFYDEFTIPENTITGTPANTVKYSKFDGSFFGAPSNRESSSINFSLSNTLEAKIKNRDTTKIEPKKIKILNALNFSSAYNFKAEEFKLSPIRVSGSIPIIKKLNLNFGATLDPYALDNNNNRIDEWNIDNGGSLFRLTNANTTFGYSISSTDLQKKKKGEEETDATKDQTFRNGGRTDNLYGRGTDFRNGNLFPDEDEDKEGNDEVKWYHYRIPWTFQAQYSVNYNNRARRDEISSHSISFSGDVELAPRWKVGASSGYDLVNKDFTFTNLRFQRDLESWTMSFNWVPFSANASWNFFIGIKSSVLSDIKWDKRRRPDRRL